MPAYLQNPYMKTQGYADIGMGGMMMGGGQQMPPHTHPNMMPPQQQQYMPYNQQTNGYSNISQQPPAVTADVRT